MHGFNMKKQAKAMQEQLKKLQEQQALKLVEGTSGGGLVTVTLNGEKNLKKIIIKPECLSDAEGLQDLILGAFEDATSKLEEQDSSMDLSKFLPF